jgi:hypothetical protein
LMHNPEPLTEIESQAEALLSRGAAHPAEASRSSLPGPGGG